MYFKLKYTFLLSFVYRTYYVLLYYIIVLYINFIYYITCRINSKYLSSQEYRTTITITITIIQILHHPLLVYVVAFYVKTMLPYVITSLTQTHLYHHIVYSITDVYYFHIVLPVMAPKRNTFIDGVDLSEATSLIHLLDTGDVDGGK